MNMAKTIPNILSVSIMIVAPLDDIGLRLDYGYHTTRYTDLCRVSDSHSCGHFCLLTLLRYGNESTTSVTNKVTHYIFLVKGYINYSMGAATVGTNQEVACDVSFELIHYTNSTSPVR
jgi:hypothetical protein